MYIVQNNLRALLKIVFLFFIIFTLTVYSNKGEALGDKKNMDAKIAYALPYDFSTLDTANIRMAQEWDILHNLYSTLVEYGPDGQIYSSFATKFYWKNNDAHFILRKDFTTPGGSKITTEDVAFSLKRLLLTKTNTHGVLGDLLIGTDKFKSITDPFAGISYDENEVVLKLKKKTPFLFTILSAADFSIIPHNAVDKNTLKITNFKETSGPYYISGFDKSNNPILSANKSHWKIVAASPKQIELVLIKSDEHREDNILQLFKNGNIDIIPWTAFVAKRKIIAAFSDLKKADATTTYYDNKPTFLLFLKYTPRGMQLSVAERLVILKDFQKAFSDHHAKASDEIGILEPAKYIFLPEAHVSLTSNQEKEVATTLAKVEVKKLSFPIQIGALASVINTAKSRFASAINQLEFVKVDDLDSYIQEKDINKMPHAIYASQDIMFFEDLTLLTFSIKNNIFNIRDSAGNAWLEKFSYEEDKAKRLNMLRDLQLSSLIKDPSIVPLIVYGQRSVAKNGWDITKQSPLSAETHYWLLEKK